MKIQCPKCQHEGTVPDDKVPVTGITATCPKCETKFRVTSPSPQTNKPDLNCPMCGTGQDKSDECTKCGIVISKFNNAQSNKKPDIEHLPLCKRYNKTKAILIVCLALSSVVIINYYFVCNEIKKVTVKQEQILYKVHGYAINKQPISDSYNSELKALLATASNIDGYLFQGKVDSTCSLINADEQFLSTLSKYLISSREANLLQSEFVIIGNKLNSNNVFNSPLWNIDIIRDFVRNVNGLKPVIDNCINSLNELQSYKNIYNDRKMSPELRKRYADLFLLLESDAKSYADTKMRIDDIRTNPAFSNPLVS